MSSNRIDRGHGSRFFRADLHIHTPASSDCEDKSKSPEDYVNAALAAGLDAIAITDHNSAEWVDRVRDAAEGTALCVFPGVEVTTPICHLLVLFDLNYPKAKLDEFLAIVGIPLEKRGKKEALGEQPEVILETAKKFGALVIAAHANSSNGLLKHAKGQYKLRIANSADLASLEFSSKEDIEDFTFGRIPGYRAKACVRGSDAHCLAEIGSRSTHFKMDSISSRCLKQALLDYPVRVRFDWNLPTDTHPQLIDLTVTQGFFDGVTFRFHPNLNCFVGGKGVGKSTVIELLRYGFEDISLIEEIAEDNRSKIARLVGSGGKITINYLDSDGEIKRVEREVQDWDTERTVSTADGVESALLAPPVLFSQGELTRIASNPIAQLDLIDRYVDVENDDASEAILLEELEANASQVHEASSRKQQLELDLTDKEKGLKVTTAQYASLEKSLKQEVLRTFPKREAEDRYLRKVIGGFALLDQEIQALISGIDTDQMFPGSLDESTPNYPELKPVKELLDKISPTLASAVTSIRSSFTALASEAKKVRRGWEPKFKTKAQQYDIVLKQTGEDDVRKAQATLRGLGERRDRLTDKAQELEGVIGEIATLREARTETLARLDDARNARFAKRSAKVAEWETVFKGTIKISIVKSDDRQDYFDALRNLLRGSNIREADIRTVITNTEPSILTHIAEQNDAASLAALAEIRDETAQKLLNCLRLKAVRELLSLETARMSDRPLIEYQVAEGRYKPLKELSTGQKGTVIISLALVEGFSPLVIDQPEEPLDTLAIHGQVVGTLRGQKDGRQFIFTTHNPNVAVGADAELNYVLEASADKGSVSAQGGIDDERTNELLLLHLEGGPEALALRTQKYILGRVED